MSVDTIQLYHNPRCSKSRETLSLLQQHQQNPEIIEYLKQPLGAEELKRVISLLGLKVREVLRKGEPAYKEAGLDNQALSDDQIIDVIISFPILLQRPIFINGDKAVIARPPTKVLDIIG